MCGLFEELLVFPAPDRMADRVGQADRRGAKRLARVAADLTSIAHSRTRVADELPADHVGVSAVVRVAEHALDGVAAQQLEEMRRFNRSQLVVLLSGRHRGEAVEQRDSTAIDLARRGL